MVIKKIEPFIVTHQLSRNFFFSQWTYDTRSICLVRITTDDGIHGWGEGYGPSSLVKAGIEYFKPVVLGENALQEEKIWQKMYLHSLDFARRGVLLAALSAIDIALWDIKGKALKQPVSVLLGGRKREQVKPYATGLYFSNEEKLSDKLAEEAVSYKELGFEAIKMKVGLGLKKDIKNVEAVREAIGSDIELMVDANHAYSYREAFQLALSMEKYDISWFEEPVSPENYDCYVQLRNKTNIPVAGGECEYLRTGFMNLFRPRCVDIAQPDICAAGGLTEVKKILSLAQTYGIDFVPHTWGTGIALSAALHLQCNQDIMPGRLYESEPFVEFDRTENPLRDELVSPKFDIENGRLVVPDQPGLGVDIEDDMLSKYLEK